MRGAALLTLVLALSACATDEPPATVSKNTALAPKTYAEIDGWTRDDQTAALQALKDACVRRATRYASNDAVGGDAIFGTGADWRPICAAAPDASDAEVFFERWFTPVMLQGDDSEAALFTAYFEPELRGARERGGPYQYPLYQKPPDLREPFFDRAEIENGALEGRGLELFWIDDPFDVFSLQIQGSGRVRLDDGSIARVGFAGKNGHPYKAIGRTLIEWDEMTLSEVSMDSIRAWTVDNPDRREALFATNPSYVFFTERTELADKPGLGPVGALGIPIYPLRSLAIDPSFYPLGTPIWVDVETPVGEIARLMVAMDVGGAIKGGARGDLFFGSGELAGLAAGKMRAAGRLIGLAPTSAVARVMGIQGAGS